MSGGATRRPAHFVSRRACPRRLAHASVRQLGVGDDPRDYIRVRCKFCGATLRFELRPREVFR